MSPIASSVSVDTFAPTRPARWLASKPETRVGIDFSDEGFCLSAVRVTARCSSLDMRELNVEVLHRVQEPASSALADIGLYLKSVESRLPRFATRGGVSASIAMPSSLQSLRCVPTSQLNDAERAIAEELGGAVQCRSWPVSSQRSMICGIRRDVAEHMIEMLRNAGYRCDNILPRSVALARTLLSASTPPTSNGIVLCWDRGCSLVTVFNQRTLKLCREFLVGNEIGEEEIDGDVIEDSAVARLSRRADEVAVETMLTLQHAMRLDNKIVPESVLVCGEMSAIEGAVEALHNVMQTAYGIQVNPWSIATTDANASRESIRESRGMAVSVSLAVGGSRLALDPSLSGGKSK